MKIFLPLCTALLLLAVAATLPVAAAEKQTASLREEMESLFQHLERKLSLQVEDAALATARQERRLTELENELKQLREEGRARIDDAQKPLSELAEKKKEEIRAAGDRYVGIVGTHGTLLAAILAAAVFLPVIYGSYQNRSFQKDAKRKLEDIEKIKRDSQELCEKYISELKDSIQKQTSIFEEEANGKIKYINELIEKYEKTQQRMEKNSLEMEKNWGKNTFEFLKNTLQSYSVTSENKVLPKAIEDAREQAKNGKGLDVLRGQAILAMNDQQWDKACVYFEDIIQQTPDDASARLNLAKSQVALADSYQITPSQQQEYLSRAEKYCQDMLQKKDTLSHEELLDIYFLYSYAKKVQAKFMEVKDRPRLYAEAEKLLEHMRALAPQDVHALGSLAELKLQQAADQNDPAERVSLRANAEQLLLQAKDLAPQDAKSYIVLARLKLQQGSEQSDSAKRTQLREQAEQLLLRAGELDPQDGEPIGLLAALKLQQAADQSVPADKMRLREQAEQLLSKAKDLAPQDANIYTLLAGLNLQQAIDQKDPEERVRLRREVENFLLKASELAPQDAKIYVGLAQLKLQQAADKQNEPTEKKRLLTAAEQFLLKARELAPQDATSYIVLAGLKSQQGVEQSNPAERVRLWKEAEGLFLRARELDPKRKEMLVMLSIIKLEQVRDAAPEERDGLLAAAESYLDELLPQDSAQGLYNRACIAALRGQQERALELLEECRKAGRLPPREHLEKDKDMDSLRDLDAFREFLKRAYPDQPDDQADAPA